MGCLICPHWKILMTEFRHQNFSSKFDATRLHLFLSDSINSIQVPAFGADMKEEELC